MCRCASIWLHARLLAGGAPIRPQWQLCPALAAGPLAAAVQIHPQVRPSCNEFAICKCVACAEGLARRTFGTPGKRAETRARHLQSLKSICPLACVPRPPASLHGAPLTAYVCPRPWDAPQNILNDAGVELGSNYEWPIISMEESRTQVPIRIMLSPPSCVDPKT